MATGEETMMNGTVNPVPLVNPTPLVLGVGGSVYGAPGPQEGDVTLVPSSQAGQADGDVIGGEEESVPSPVEEGGVPPRRQAGPVTTGDSSPDGGLPLTKVELGSSVNNESGTSSTAESGTTNQTTSMRFTGQEHLDRIGESIEAQKAKVAELEERMRLPDMQSLVDEKYRARLSALEKTGTLPPEGPERERVLRRLHRKAAREAEREYEAARDIRDKWLDPDYEPDKEYERQQNILSVISALGDLGAMAGRAVTAANSGIILPFESLSSGRTKDRKQSDKERQALKAGLEQLAQARREKEEAKLADLEKSRLDLLKNPNLYEREVSGSTSRNAETRTSKKGTTGATERTYGGETGGSGGSGGGWGSLKNGEYLLNGRNGEYKLTDNGATEAMNSLFKAYTEALMADNSVEKKDGQPKNEGAGTLGGTWAAIRNLMGQVRGAADADQRQKYQRELTSYTQRMMDYLRGRPGGEAAIDAYEEIMQRQMLDGGYRPFNETTETGAPGLGTRAAGDSDKDMDW